MDTDRQLLEDAAKAAGWQVVGYDTQTSHIVVQGQREKFGYQRWYWNPLTDDGDAMRLAVHFRMSVVITDVGVSARCFASPGIWADVVAAGDEIAAATRRAIVRAAVAMAQT